MGKAIFESNPPAEAAHTTSHSIPKEVAAGPLEPIAIVGLSCRYPGGASNPEKLWERLAKGSSAWSHGPGKRFNMEAFLDPQNAHISTTNTDGGHFLSEDIAAFDASFFGISAAEATAMDPQQRLMLEVAYEAFENAGLSPDSLWAKNVGVYIGQWTSDYAEVLARDTEFPALHHATGANPGVSSNRISYHFNLLGPSFTTDTGCSSSLVALHSAVRSIRSGETEMSFVGGVNLLVDPQRFVYQSKMKMFSKDGRSFPFDHRANGYGRGEGCGGVVLKPLSAALRDGDNIRALIRNSVLNQDGRTPGISVPSGEAQESAIRKAYKDAGLELGADYVEAHGTGTAVGDPIELKAIASALSKSQTGDKKLPVGSIKGNIGHTESAAGIAGLIKAVLMLEKNKIPPQANFEKPNSKILLDDWHMRVPQKLEPVELNRISVNSFGYGGTNAHVILDSARDLQTNSQAADTSPSPKPRICLISGASERTCQKFAADLAEFVSLNEAEHQSLAWLDQIAYTLSQRPLYRYRKGVVAEDAETLISKLKAVSQQPIAPSIDKKKLRLAFVFGDQDTQYGSIARGLLKSCSPFKDSLERANKHLASLGSSWDVFEELARPAQESKLDEPKVGQPLSTAVQLSLISAFAAIGITANAVTGYSSGEIAAAYSAGYIGFEDAIAASYHRGRLASELEARRVEDEYLATLRGLKAQDENSSTTMISSITGSVVKAGDVNGKYWSQNLLPPVRFEDALRGLCQGANGAARVDIVVEVGPSSLEDEAKQTIQLLEGDAAGIRYISTKSSVDTAESSFFEALASLYSEGVSFDLQSVNNGFKQGKSTRVSNLPPYAFDHDQTYWHESRISKNFTHRQLPPHELIGNLSADSNELEPCWRRFVNLKDFPWLLGHAIQGQVIFPASGYLAMAVEAIRRHTLKVSNYEAKISSYEFHNVSIGKAFVLSEDMKEHEIRVHLRPEARTARNSSNTWLEFRIFTVAPDMSWSEHCRGYISATTVAKTAASEDSTDFTISPEEVEQAEQSSYAVSSEKFYFTSKDVGLDWKSPFDNVSAMKLGPDTSLYDVSVPNLGHDNLIDNTPQYLIHPATLDAALFHGLCAILLLKKGLDSPPVPTFISDLSISADHHDLPGNDLACYATRSEGPFSFDVIVKPKATSSSQAILRATGVSVTKLPGDFAPSSSARELTHSVQWATYCQAITPQRVEAICSPTVVPGSVAEQNKLMDALVLSHIQRAVKEVAPEDVTEGYCRQWYTWMKSNENETYDPSLLANSYIDATLGHLGVAINGIGNNLAGILKGKVEPLDILNKDGLLTQLYADERCQRCYAQMGAYIKELGRQNPGMKILEVGAGTGGATEPILETLFDSSKRLVSKYEFTDISSGFFEAAKERLGKFSDVLNYRVFDAEKDVAAQGYEPGAYDLVMACNVVHATKSIGKTLDGIKSLLRPGGTFVLMEITTDQLYYNLIFGSLSGWWLGDGEGRISSPLLPESRWTKELTSHGFKEPTAYLRDYPVGEGTLTAFISTVEEKANSSLLPVEVFYDQTQGAEVSAFVEDLQTQLDSKKVSATEIQDTVRQGVISVFPPEVCEALASDLSPKAWGKFKERCIGSKALLFITRGATGFNSTRPIGAMMTGFARCLRIEQPDCRIVTLDLDEDAKHASSVVATILKSPSFDINSEVSTIESEFAERDGQIYVVRVFHEPTIDRYIHDVNGASEPEVSSFLNHDRILTAELEVPGLLDTLRWKDVKPSPLDPDEIQLDLRAASINFKDVLIAAGQLEGITEMRNDCSGIVTHVGAHMTGRFKVGDRVCSYYSKSYTNRPRVHGNCCAVIPENLSYEEGASLPIVWGTVYFSLVDRGRLAKGNSVLIHSAAGAVGQAAILLAQHLGAEVFVTVSTAEKREFLSKTYGIPEDHMFSSRSISFGKSVRKMTGGRGVDVVLNSLSGDMFRETCNTVAPFGRFVEIGRKDFMEDMKMPTKFFLKNITFAYVDLALMIDDNKPLVRRVLKDVIDLMGSGAIRPTSIMTMPISEIESAFRQIQAGKHIGKVILTVEDDQQAKIVPAPPAQLANLKADGSYVIIGGLGGLGKTMVPWMASRGARNIIVSSRSGSADDAKTLIEEMRQRGVSLLVKRCDASNLESVKALVKDIEEDKSLGPIRGVINSAMVIKDNLLANMTHDEWIGALNPKIPASWNLHQALPSSIDFLLFMSSNVAISGNPGQCNYAAGCSFQDSLAHYRCTQGLPSYSLNVGAVVDMGYVSENPDVAMALRRQGLGSVMTSQVLANVDYILSQSVTTDPTKCQSVLGVVPVGNEPGLRPSTWLSQSRFRHLARHGGNSSESSSGGNSDSLEALEAAATPEEALELITEAILQQLSKLIATPVKQLSAERSLDDYGVDSLVAVELRNWLNAYLHASVALFAIRSTKSIKELAQVVSQESRLSFAR